MIAEAVNYYEIISRLPEDAEVTFHNISWQEYEELLEQVGEASGLRLAYDNGSLQVMTLSTEHEKFVRFFESLITAIRLRLRINILSFGSATMRRRNRSAGKEPDACFYVQSAAAIGNKITINFAEDPPPDIAVEVDIHHGSQDKFPIYAALGVPEIWRFDGQTLTIFLLQQGDYVVATGSLALPMLTSDILTDYLRRLRDEGEFQTLLAFDEWLQSL